MHAEDIVEEFPVVTVDSNALDAARTLAEHRLPGIVVTDSPGCHTRSTRIAGSAVPRADLRTGDPSLAGVLNESMADHAADKLGNKTVRQVLRTPDRRAAGQRG